MYKFFASFAPALVLLTLNLSAQSVDIAPSKDNTIYSDSTHHSNALANFIFSGVNNNGDIRRALIAFDIASSVPAMATIDSVELILNMSRSNSPSRAVTLHRLTTNWGEESSMSQGMGGVGTQADTGDASWSHAVYDSVSWTMPGGDFNATPSATTMVDTPKDYSWSSMMMTSDVQGWLDDASTNFGWVIITDEASTPSAKRFDSRQNPNAANQPILRVHYTEQQQSGPAAIFINEIHYNNVGQDVDEGFEIAGPAGTDLSCYEVVLYNGNGNEPYSTIALSGIIDNESCGWGAVWFGLPNNGLQNGSPDGIALVYNPNAAGCGGTGTMQLIQFISYEGTMTGLGGPADGVLSSDIGVEQPNSVQIGESMQLSGQGAAYDDFIWNESAAHSRDVINPNQDFCLFPIVDSTVSLDLTVLSVTEGDAPVGIAASADELSAGSQFRVDLVLTSGDAAQIDNYVTQSFSFNAANNGLDTIWLTISDDTLFESTKTLNFALRNAIGRTQIGEDSLLVLTLFDNDTLSDAHFAFANINAVIDEDGGSVDLTVNYNNPIGAATVEIAANLNASSASFSSDYQFTAQTLSFTGAANESQTVTVDIINDVLLENPELVVIELSAAGAGIRLIDSVFSISIQDDDVLILSFDGTDRQTTEAGGNIPFEVTLTAQSTSATGVTIEVDALSTATEGTDFNLSQSSLTFGILDTSRQSFSVDIIDDSEVETDESVVLRLSQPTNGAQLATSVIALNISDNDTLVDGIFSPVQIESFEVSPVPSSNTIEIRFEAGFNAYTIYDLNGRQVAGADLSQITTRHSMNISELNAGIYLIELQSADARLRRYIEKM